MKKKFREVKLSKANLQRLELINEIIEEYQDEGYILTLRQLYYQLVSRDVIPNKSSEYSKLSTLLKEGRMGGIVDWEAIEDRLRKPSKPASWEHPSEILESAIYTYALPRMKGQETYIEVWVEKDALSGVLSRVTKKFHIPIMVNRGYSSASAMYDSFNRFKYAHRNKQNIVVLYLGDFDPSGVDMIRDIHSRIYEFADGDFNISEFDFQIKPIALTIEQIKAYNPPPNPAKITDPRAAKFIDNFGATSWEVDALRPEVLNDILENSILELIDFDAYQSIVDREDADKEKLTKLKDLL